MFGGYYFGQQFFGGSPTTADIPAFLVTRRNVIIVPEINTNITLASRDMDFAPGTDVIYVPRVSGIKAPRRP